MATPAFTVADVLCRFGAAYLAKHTLGSAQAKVRRAIVACRTAALGGELLACDACGHRHWQYHSCRNRHCGQCGARAKHAWLQARLAEVLAVPYAHLVFTLPHGLKRHVHLHAVMACGVLDKTGQWQAPTRQADFLFPVHALSKVFRGKFMAALAAARRHGQTQHDPQGVDALWHRTAIGNERIRAIDQSQVAFTVRANEHGGKRLERLEGQEFVHRFMLHVLPRGLKRIRHYAVLAAPCKRLKLAAATRALHSPESQAQASECAHAFMARAARIDRVSRDGLARDAGCACRRCGHWVGTAGGCQNRCRRARFGASAQLESGSSSAIINALNRGEAYKPL